MNLIERISIFENLQSKLSYLSDENLFIDDLCSKLLEEIDDTSDEKEKKILILVYEICRIHLSEDMSNPFIPYQRIQFGITSAIPEFFTNDELEFYYGIYEKVKNKMFKAKIADILWYLKYKKNIEHPRYAISVYTNLDIESSKQLWKHLVYVRRGLYLAIQIKFDLEKIDTKFTQTFLNHVYENTSYLVRLAEVLREFKLGKKQSEDIANKLIISAENLELSKQFNLAEQYYDEASNWGSKEKYTEIQVKRAFAYIHNAEDIESNGLMEGIHYENAIKNIRALDKNERSKYITPEKEEELISKLQSAGRFAITQMGEHKIKMDVADVINDIILNMKGNTKEDALKQFAFISNFVKSSEIEKSSIEQLQNSPLMALCTHVMYASDGRVVARETGKKDNLSLDRNNPSVWQAMIWNYNLQISLTVQTGIINALNVLLSEHFISEHEITEIVRIANIIPCDRQKVFIKGIMAGFSFDFITSLHLLVPQIENLVREQLHIHGIRTITLDKDGIEVEVGLSTLVEKTEFTQIFGEDIAFEIRALMCESTGSNLRNNVAHGLLNENEMQSAASIYFWWFCFKLVYMQYIAASKSNGKTNNGAKE